MEMYAVVDKFEQITCLFAADFKILGLKYKKKIKNSAVLHGASSCQN